MRIRKRPAAPSAPPSGSDHVTVTDGLEETHLSSMKASTPMQLYHEPAAAKPLKSLHLTAHSNSSNGNHKYPSIPNVRKPLLDRLQHHNGASYSASANPRTAVCDKNPSITQIPQSTHGVGLAIERRSSPTSSGSNLYGLNIANRNSPVPASPVRVSSSATQRAGSANYHERSSNRADTGLHNSTLSPEDMPELLIIPVNSTKTGIDSLQEKDMEKLPLQRAVAQPRKRRKTDASSSNLRESKLRLQEKSSINKEAAKIDDSPKLQQTKGKADDASKKPGSTVKDVSLKKDLSMKIASQLLARDDVKPNILTRKTNRGKKKMKSKNMLKNQLQREATVVTNDKVSETPGSTVVRQCNRQDGRRWRCKKPAAPGHLYCEYHSAKMSKSFRLKLLQQQTQQDEISTLQKKQEQSTLQQNQEQSTPQHKFTGTTDNRHSFDHQLDLNISINVEGSPSSSTTTDDLHLNDLDLHIIDRHKQPKLIDQQVVSNRSAEEPTHDNVQLQHSPILNSKPIHESANRTGHEARNTNGNIRLNKVLEGRSNGAVKKKPGNSIRGRWRKKCKPLLRKLNEIKDVVTPSSPIRNNSDVNDDSTELSPLRDRDDGDGAAGNVNSEDFNYTNNSTHNPLNPSKESDIEPTQAVIRASMELDAEKPGTDQSSTDSEDEEIKEKGTEPNSKHDLTEKLSTSSKDNCSSSGIDLCTNNYKITLTSTGDCGVSSSYVISQIHLSAFTKLLQAAAAESVQNFHVGDIITDGAEQQRQQTHVYGNGGSSSPARTEEVEALPECVLNSDPCEWRSDLFH